MLGSVKRWWVGKPEEEQKRIKSFIPLVLYTFAFIYFVIYLSILNSVNRYKDGSVVKSGFGGDNAIIIEMQKRQEEEIQKSFKFSRKRVSGELDPEIIAKLKQKKEDTRKPSQAENKKLSNGQDPKL